MSYSNGTITAPISASDPYNCMGVGKTSSGYDVGYICKNSHGKINKWSRHKPVKFNKITELSDADFKSVNFGLTMPTPVGQNWETAINNAQYVYNPPTGGSSEPFRLTDFNYYRTTTIPPCKAAQDIKFDTTTGETFNFSLNLNHYGHDDYNIGIDEIPNLSSYYLAVILKYDDGRGHTYNLWKTASSPLSGGSYTVTFTNLDNVTMHNIKYYLCGASRAQNEQTTAISYVDFIGLPFESSSAASANVTLTSTNPFQVNFLGCAGASTSSNYITKEDAVPGGLAFTLSGNRGIWIQSEVTALVYYTLEIKNLYGEIRPCSVYGTATDRTTTTGEVPLELWILSGGTWTKITASTFSFNKGTKYTIRVGRQDWAYYQNGVKKNYLKTNYIYDDAYIWSTDKKTGYSLGGITTCRLGLYF